MTPPRWARRLLILVAIVAAVGWVYSHYIYQPVIFGLRDDFVKAVPNQDPPRGVASLSAKSCGVCHRAIYAEWKTSIHSRAYVDPFYQAYWKKDDHIWICANCHNPLENQQPIRVLGLNNGKIDDPITEPNPMFDEALQQEGINCAGCHVRDGIIYGPYKDASAPHPTAYDPKFTNTDICYWCHQVPSGPFQFYNGGPCATFFEFEDGPYARQGYTCQSCHMPLLRRPAAIGGPVRETRQHLWRGGHDPAMLKRALQVTLLPDQSNWKKGDKLKFTARLRNGGAGHKIPTGDPDRRFTVHFELLDGDGQVVKQATHTIGRWLIWKPIIVELYENRIPPLTERDYTFKVAARAGHRLRLTVKYHIVTERARNSLIKKYGFPADEPYQFTLYEQTLSLDQGHYQPPAPPVAKWGDRANDDRRCMPHPA